MDIYLRRLVWITLTLVFYLCLHLSIFEKIDGAENLAIFYVWFCFTANLITAIAVTADDKMKLLLRKKGKIFPSYIMVSSDVIPVIAMVWFGWWWCGSAYLMQCFFEYTAHQIADLPTEAEKRAEIIDQRFHSPDDLWDIK